MARTLASFLSSSWCRFREDRRGGVAIIGAAAIVALLGMAAIVADVGNAYTTRRRAQAAADIAAMVAASNLANATGLARSSLTDNGFDDVQELIVQPGVYTPDPSLPSSGRFVPGGGAAANAARVRFRTSAPILLGRVVSGSDSFPISVEATAATSQMAAFSIGSRLASLNGGLLNSLLGALLGTNVALTVMDYEALATARIDALRFLDALRIQARVSAGTYRDVLTGSVSVADALKASANALNGGADPRARSVLQLLGNSGALASATLATSKLLDIGPYAGNAIGDAPPFEASVSALNMLMALAQLANGSRQANASLALNLPGIASVQLQLSIGERPQGRSWFAVGPTGTTVHTAQTRLYLKIGLVGSGILPPVVNVPVHVDVAAADARLASITCGTQATDIRVGIAARPGVVDAWIGDVTPAQMKNFTTPVSANQAVLVDVAGMIRVKGRAHVVMSNLREEILLFQKADIDQHRAKTVQTRDYTSSLVSGLVSDLQLDAEVPGSNLLGPLFNSNLVKGALKTLLTGATPTLDTLLGGVLNAFGLRLGEADVWVEGVRCDGAVLVN
ncbi:TadG family pilus assembly protein [Chelatococcus sp. SYSU_G07232]|uniref:TadG family pilus assembly protein n=1 Tax=Chelatococcus albus TaxID=3047466 RepID=A0ABT7AKG3_9HYPH|nr:TadG family pilus assembly protein [Chelatococcus sp. SYSU_G07232]MDJ1159472.1 TadG family pilus assembly protein [Chelatococcus sp. SYSU_G07232]